MSRTRLGIFVFYDKDGIVDGYIPHMLQDMVCNLTDLYIVCNGMLRPEGREIFERFTDKIFVRENTGYDVMAYKAAFTEYCGWENICGYDEVVLFNDTFFGPIGTFQTVFDEMGGSPADFWGISRYYGGEGSGKNEPKTYTYIQYYFIVFRSGMVKSKAFQDYWDEIDATDWSFTDILLRHEWSFTGRMLDRGFTYDTYIKAGEYEYGKPELNHVQYFSVAYELVKDHRFPVIKKKAFAGKNFRYSPGGDIRKTLDYVQENGLYDTDLIWQHILRIYNIKDVYQALHLDYVLPTSLMPEPKGHSAARTAVLVYVKDAVFLDNTLSYIQSLPEEIVTALCTDAAGPGLNEIVSICSRYETVKMKQMQNQSMQELFRSTADLTKQTDYLCIIAPDMEETDSAYKRKLLHDIALENTIASGNYAKSVIGLFGNNPRMGYLSVPAPIHNEYFGMIGNEWQDCFPNTKNLAKRLKLQCKLSEDVACFGETLGFWCRTKALQPLIDLALTSGRGSEQENQYGNRVWSRIYPYLAQDKGYFSGTVMSGSFASYRLSTMEYTLAGILNQYRSKGEITDFQSAISLEVLQFARQKRRIYIFGTGGTSEEVFEMLERYEIPVSGFIVSDDIKNEKMKDNLQVYTLSEAPLDLKNDGIVVAIHKRHQVKALPEIREKNYSYVVW